MKGLLIKDFYFVFKNKIFMIMVFLLIAVHIVNKALGLGEGNFVIIFIILNFGTSLGLGSITNDENYKWNIYCDTLPVSRKTVVLEKYLFSFLNLLVLWFIPFISDIVIMLFKYFNADAGVFLANDIGYYTTFLAFAMVILAVLFPFIFKFGIVKAKLMVVILIGCYGAFIGVGTALFDETSESFSGSMHAFESFPVIAIVAVATATLLYIISMLISVKIYENKEL